MPFNITYFQEISLKHFLIVQELCNTKSLKFEKVTTSLLHTKVTGAEKFTAHLPEDCWWQQKLQVLSLNMSKYFFKLIDLLES